MYLSPLSVKTKHARVGSFTTCLGCPRFSLTNSCSVIHVDVRGVEPLSKQIISYTLYIRFVNVLMISQNILFKPL